MEVEVDLEYPVALFYFSLIITFSDDLLSGGYVPIMIATISRRHLFLRPPVLLLVAQLFIYLFFNLLGLYKYITYRILLFNSIFFSAISTLMLG